MGSRDAIAAHMKKVLETKLADGSIPDGESAVSSALMPSFSAGTLPLDPDSGRPVVSHEATQTAIDSTVAVGDPTGVLTDDDADAGAAQQAATAGKAAATPEAPRDDKGKFAKPVAATTPQQSKPKTQKQAAAAAEEAAGDILDEWADAAELEFSHDDGTKYKVRTPKAHAKQVERFNQRQAQVERHAAWMAKYRPVLEPLISGGQLDPVLPLLQRALSDNEFRDFVSQAYNRRLIGQPLTPQGTQVVDRTTPAQATPAATAIPEITDPYIAEMIGPVLARYQAENQAVREQLAQFTQQQESYTQQQQRAQAEQAQREGQLRAAHEDLARLYPAAWTGDLNRDRAVWDAAVRYAKDSGYAQMYGIRGGVRLAAEQIMRDRAETASPAAAMIEQVDRASMRAAQAQAASARSVTGGTSRTAPPPKPAPPQRPSPRDNQGRLKDKRQHMQELIAFAEAQQAAG